jgi:hypothetical protein
MSKGFVKAAPPSGIPGRFKKTGRVPAFIPQTEWLFDVIPDILSAALRP